MCSNVFEIYILVALVGFMLAGAIPIGGEVHSSIFRTPAFAILLGLLSISLIISSIKEKLKFGNIGSHLTRLSIILILIGGFISSVKEAKFSFMLPVNEGYTVRKMPLKDKKTIDLGFELTLKSFEVSRYKPDFAVYKPNVDLYRKSRISPNGTLDLGLCGKFKVISYADNIIRIISETNEEIVFDEGAQSSGQYILKNGYLLRLLKPKDKQYKATLGFILDGISVEKEMYVNKPVNFKGWIFYLYSYDRQSEDYIIITARRDPGRKIVLTGLLGLMIGIAMLFYRRTKNE